MQEEGIRITGDESRKLKVQPLKLLKGVLNLLKDLSPTNITSLPADAVDMVESISLGDEPGQLAKMLICRSLVDALLNLIAENNGMFLKKEDIETEQLDAELEAVLSQNDFFVGDDFFNRPDQSPFFDTISPFLVDFLRLFDFSDNEIELIFGRLKSYFVFSLVKEWRRNAERYQKIESSLKTPFDTASKREGEWLLYSRYLEREIDKPVFSELFGLRQIYVPLRAFYKKKIKSKDQEELVDRSELSHSYKKEELIVVDLKDEVFRWLKKGDREDAIRVVRGGPGYGKSSFMKMLAANLLAQNYKIIFIPLHRFELKDDLVDAVRGFLKYDKFLTFDPFDEELLILIFDGLDELSMQGKLLADVANGFISEIQRKVSNFNNQKTKLQVLISGRDVIIQQNEKEWRKDGQILSILPYYLDESDRKEYEDVNDLLRLDQRDIWWKNYGNLNGKNYNGLPSDLKGKDFEEITAQPLLNYLLALSFERGKISFTKETNLNVVYNDLLEAVYERAYDPAKTHVIVRKMEPDHFSRMLEEVAVAAWHGNGRTTTVQEIEKHFSDGGLKRILDAFVCDAEKGIVSLLAAFYFRQAGTNPNGYQTFEFTHKSFGEYLTAKSIIRKVKLLSKKYIDHQNDFDEGWTIKECLLRWIELFGNKSLDEDIMRFVNEEFSIILDNESDRVSLIQKTIIDFINHMLDAGMPMELLNPRPDYRIENDQAINAEKALLVLLGTVSRITNKISDILWPYPESFGEWIGRLFGQRVSGDAFVLQYLNNMNISNLVLHIRDFYSSNISYSDMEYNQMAFVNMRRAFLMGVNLSHATLVGGDFEEALLKNANLMRADLNMANLKTANLEDANLEGANLERANLEGANLEGANLERANLKGANLKGANLEGAKGNPILK